MVIPASKFHRSRGLNSYGCRRFDVSRLSQPEVVKQYQQALADALQNQSHQSNETSETLWSFFSQAVSCAATNHLGFSSKPSAPDWFYDNLDAIQPLLLRKKQLLSQVLSARKAKVPVSADLLTQYRSARNHTKYLIYKIQNRWWKNKAEELNRFHSQGDLKNLFSSWKLLSTQRRVHVSSVLDESGSNVISDPIQIRNRWRAHFSRVLNVSISTYDDSVFNIIPQQPVLEELARPPSIEEVRCALAHMKCNRAAGKDGIPVELLVCGGEQALTYLHSICSEVWTSELIPKEWVDSVIVPIPKKGNLQLCDNWRGISLLSVAGKVFARILANRIAPIAESVLDESQCGFRKCRGTIDMIFVARQLQEKAREQMCQLYMCFFDLKKAYDSVPRDALWLLLTRLGFPSKLVHILRGLHVNMEASVRVDGVLSEPFQVSTGLKQGCVLAPFLFNLYFNKVMHQVLSDLNDGVEIKYRLDGKLFRRSGTRLPMSVRICDLRFADDVMTGCLSSDALQSFIDRFTRVACSWGLSVSTDKTKAMIQPYTCSLPFSISSNTIETVSSFQYLGSALSSDASLDNEINNRISKAAKQFSALKCKVWYNANLSKLTKLAVFNATVIPALLYGAETWPTTAYLVRRVNSFLLACLRQALSINPLHHIPDTTVLARSHLQHASTLISIARLRWLGHVYRMEDNRLPKQILFGEISSAKRPQHKPKLRWRDCVSKDLSSFGLSNNWQSIAVLRSQWRTSLFNGAALMEAKLNEKARMLRDCHKGASSLQHGCYCSICNKGFTSEKYLRSHNTQKHGQHARATHPLTHPPRATHSPSDFSCPVPLCSFTSNSIKGIKIHQHHKHKEQAGEASTNQYTQSVLCPASDCHFRSTCAKGVKIHLRKTHSWSKADVDAVEL